jgi:predicted NBD/HSP70 family sugar kinase
VDFRAGFCLYAPLHPKWKNVPLKKIFEQKFGVPCFVDHDCNCFALSEKLFGFGRDLEDFLCVLLGEGVSAGIVINGEVYRGSECFSGEFGHTCIEMNGPECACGNTGCLETYISGSALARIAAEEVRQRPESRILAIAGGNAEKITAETLCLAAQQGDALAANLFKRMGVYLGVGVANLIILFNPARVILVGRLTIAYRFFLPTFFETLEKRAWHASTRDVSISGLERGAVMGAAALVLQEAFTSGLIMRRKA